MLLKSLSLLGQRESCRLVFEVLDLGLHGYCGEFGSVRMRRTLGLDASGSHVVEKLVRYLRQDVFGQTSHTQDVVAPRVDVIPERHKLDRRRKK